MSNHRLPFPNSQITRKILTLVNFEEQKESRLRKYIGVIELVYLYVYLYLNISLMGQQVEQQGWFLWYECESPKTIVYTDFYLVREK